MKLSFILLLSFHFSTFNFSSVNIYPQLIADGADNYSLFS